VTDKAADIAAYIGALAWAPQIASWVWKAVSRPRLRVRTAKNLQLGHGGLGGALGLNVSIASEEKDALVDGVRAVVTHEKGDRREFVWVIATEHQNEMRNDSGERVQVSRTQSVLALKVSTVALTERYLSFVDSSEEATILAGQNAARVAYEARTAAGNTDWDGFLVTREAQGVRTELERAFHWQDGRYRMELVLSMVGAGQHTERFEFNLSRADIEKLKANYSRWAENLSAVVRGTDWVVWNWVYPALARP